jgi:hypothetical protein
MSLRIISESTARNMERSVGTGSRSVAELEDTYITRLGKLVPGEAITAYPLFFVGAKQLDGGSVGNMVMLTSWVVFIVVVVLRCRATMSPEGRAQWPAVAISAIAFVIWVYVMEGDFGIASAARTLAPKFSGVPLQSDQVKFIASLALFAWTLIAPALYTGDRG